MMMNLIFFFLFVFGCQVKPMNVFALHVIILSWLLFFFLLSFASWLNLYQSQIRFIFLFQRSTLTYVLVLISADTDTLCRHSGFIASGNNKIKFYQLNCFSGQKHLVPHSRCLLQLIMMHKQNNLSGLSPSLSLSLYSLILFWPTIITSVATNTVILSLKSAHRLAKRLPAIRELYYRNATC